VPLLNWIPSLPDGKQIIGQGIIIKAAISSAVSRKGNRHLLYAGVIPQDNLAVGVSVNVKSPETLHASGGLPAAKILYNNNKFLHKFLYSNILCII
jgi:hypothetical protein